MEKSEDKGTGATSADVLEILKVAYAEARRTLDQQVADVAVARQRVLTILGIVFASSAFMAGQVVSDGDRSALFWVLGSGASVLFVVVLLLTYLCLNPIREWRSEVEPSKLVQHYVHDPRGAEAAYAYENIVLEFGEWIDSNWLLLDSLRLRLQATILVAGAQLLLLFALLWAAA